MSRTCFNESAYAFFKELFEIFDIRDSVEKDKDLRFEFGGISIEFFEDVVENVFVLRFVSLDDIDVVRYSLQSNGMANFITQDIVEVHFDTVLRVLGEELLELFLHGSRADNQLQVGGLLAYLQDVLQLLLSLFIDLIDLVDSDEGTVIQPHILIRVAVGKTLRHG